MSGRPWTTFELARLREWAQTRSAADIATVLGRTEKAVISAASVYKIRMQKRGLLRHGCKYSPALRTLIQLEHQAGEGPKALAARHGVPLCMVKKWVHG